MFLELAISGKVVDHMVISFEGLSTVEERQAHAEGLAKWMVKKFPASMDEVIEVFIDRVPSGVNVILNQEKVDELNEKVFKRPRTNTKHEIKVRKKVFEDEPEPAKIIRIKGDHTNRHWWEEAK